MTKSLLIIYSRYPEPGKSKSRLIPRLGPEGAAQIQSMMTRQTLQTAIGFASDKGVSLELHFEGGGVEEMENAVGVEVSCVPQAEGDLGERMAESFLEGFRRGFTRIIIVGSDVPGISQQILADAFRFLDRYDLSLGPARDGGYYLIGMKKSSISSALPAIFENIPWGSRDVMEETLKAVGRSGLDYALLETLCDVDEPDDLHIWEEIKKRKEELNAPGRISVVIPSLNEAGNIRAALETARSGENVEVIVVDGGSSDGTATIAGKCGAMVIESPPGRARQMNEGAAAATGEILLFLHADTLLPENYDRQVRKALAETGVVAGAFSFKPDFSSIGMSTVTKLANWRSKKLEMPYGDQAIFMKVSVFRRAGGFPDMPIMEDFELMRKLRKRGRVITLPSGAVTSARRWRRYGVLRTTLINQAVIAGYYLGVPTSRLARLYRRNG